MICYIEGEVIAISSGFVAVKTNLGIGYEVFCIAGLISSLNIGDFVKLHTSFIVKEDGHYLYGFATLEELIWFKNLLKVSGVGAKTALAVLNDISIDDIVFAIQSKNEGVFASVSGLGKKTASRLVADMEKDPYKTSIALSSIILAGDLTKTQGNNYTTSIKADTKQPVKALTPKVKQHKTTESSEAINNNSNMQKLQNKNLINDATLALEALGYSKMESFTKVSLIVKGNPQIKLDELIKTCLQKD